MRFSRVLILILVLLAAWGLTGVCIVQTDELAVTRRFGRLLEPPREPGLYLGLPWGLDRVERIKPREIRSVLLGGTRLAGDAAGSRMPQVLTGDRNLINVHATVHFVISDPLQFVRHRHQVDELVATAGESCIAHVFAHRAVDSLLTQGKAEAASEIRDELQQLSDRYDLGIAVRTVDLGSVEPPPEVAESFAAVVSAQRERDQVIHQAHSYADQSLAQAKSDAQRLIDVARGENHLAVRTAMGEATRFRGLLQEYRRAPAVTSFRLYHETLEEILPRLRTKLVIDRGQPIDFSIFANERRSEGEPRP